MAYKEIQVPNGTVRSIYSNFMLELQPLLEKEQERTVKQAQIYADFFQSEKEIKSKVQELRSKYPDLIRYGIADYVDFNFYDLSHNPYKPVSMELDRTKAMLGAVQFSEGNITMTEAQVEEMRKVSSGEIIKSLQDWLATDLHTPESEWKWRLEFCEGLVAKIEKKTVDAKPAPVKAPDPEEEHPGFIGALLGFIALGALIVVMLKACGG